MESNGIDLSVRGQLEMAKHFAMSRQMVTAALFCFAVETVRCVLIQKPDDFQLYWNIPSFQCRPHKIFFTNVTKKYGIVQNDNDNFRGENIAILYDPGNFPALLKNAETGELVYRNGGVPQNGNLTLHIKLFKEIIEQLIPNNNFSGVGIIDFESWRPIFRQNFGVLTPYKNISYAIEQKLHPTWSKPQIEEEATKRFEDAGRDFVEETLHIAKEMRPNALWGYYAYPYCFNLSPGNMNTQCSEGVVQENDRLKWLFQSTSVLFPSIYLSQNSFTSQQMLQLVEGRIQEAKRIANSLNKVPQKPKILPYMWLKFRDSQQYMSKDDLTNVITLLKAMKTDGAIIWGSSNDVSSRVKCNMLYNYVDQVLGPIIMENNNNNNN